MIHLRSVAVGRPADDEAGRYPFRVPTIAGLAGRTIELGAPVTLSDRRERLGEVDPAGGDRGGRPRGGRNMACWVRWHIAAATLRSSQGEMSRTTSARSRRFIISGRSAPSYQAPQVASVSGSPTWAIARRTAWWV